MLRWDEFKVYDTMIKKLYQSTVVEEIRPLIMNHLSHLIPYDSGAFFTADPETFCFSEPFILNLNASLFHQYKLYYEDKDEYKKAVFSGNSIPIIDRSSDYMDYKKWAKNEHRADFLLPHGMHHLACLQILNDNRLIGEISLHRSANSPDFSDREMDILRLLHGHINNAFHNASLLNNHSPLETMRYTNGYKKTGLCLVDSNGKITGSNPLAENILTLQLVTGQNVYSYLKEICCHLITEHKNRSVSGPYFETGSLNFKDGKAHFKIIILEDENINHRPHCLIIINMHYNPHKADWKKNNAIKFTKREMDVITLIVEGKTNKEISQALFISENTVKTYIKRIFTKTGVTSRTELIYNL